MMAKLSSTLIEIDWLQRHIGAKNIRIFDASWYMPAEQRSGYQEYLQHCIPGALFFDIDALSERETSLPHMLPSTEIFTAAMRAAGVDASDQIVVYDGAGIFSAARAWWMLRAFGHASVAVLNGGLPAWRAAGYEMLNGSEGAGVHSNIFHAEQGFAAVVPTSSFVSDLTHVETVLSTGAAQVVDARSAARFLGEQPDPRPGVRSGHMPKSINLPYSTLLDSASGRMLPPNSLREAFESAGIDLNRPIVTSCGSGVTASILTLGLQQLGITAPVYDGSWAEWGASPHTPVARETAI